MAWRNAITDVSVAAAGDAKKSLLALGWAANRLGAECPQWTLHSIAHCADSESASVCDRADMGLYYNWINDVLYRRVASLKEYVAIYNGYGMLTHCRIGVDCYKMEYMSLSFAPDDTKDMPWSVSVKNADGSSLKVSLEGSTNYYEIVSCGIGTGEYPNPHDSFREWVIIRSGTGRPTEPKYAPQYDVWREQDPTVSDVSARLRLQADVARAELDAVYHAMPHVDAFQRMGEYIRRTVFSRVVVPAKLDQKILASATREV